MTADLTVRAIDARELMDDPAADLQMLERTYARFPLVNAAFSGWRGVYRRDIRPRAGSRRLRVLDVGCGGGDLARAIARRLRRTGCDAEVTGLDTDPRAIDWAERRSGGDGVRWRCASTADLAAAGETYDVIVSNHVLHHLTAEELADLLADCRALTAAGGVAVHSDIARSAAAYALFRAVTLPFARNLLAGSFIREDGMISIRRSYTAAELAAATPPDWRVEKRMPARLLLRREAEHA